MENQALTDAIRGVGNVSQNTAKYLPEPATTGVGTFRDAMDLVGQVGGSLARTALGASVPGFPSADFAELIAVQLEVQRELQTTTMVANVEKTRHESKMAPIRNIRAN